jgi:site-specific recombinase XerC
MKKDTTMAINKRYLTDEEQRRLLQVVKAHGSPLAQRDYAWMRLLIETGMRINELATTTYWQAVQGLSSGWLVIKKEQRKGKRCGHEYMVTEPVRQCLETLLKLHDELRPMVSGAVHSPAPLLWGRCGVVKGVLLQEHMSVRSFQARMKHWGYLAGLPDGVSPHWLRHTRGVNIIRRSRGNNPLKVAQLALGHASIASTGIYTQMSREEFAQEMQTIACGRMSKASARAIHGGAA